MTELNTQESPAGKSGFDPRFGIRYLEKALNWERRIFSPDRFDWLADWSARCGNYGLIAAQALSVIFCLIAAIALKSWEYVGYAVGFAALLAILQFTTDRFLKADRSMIQASPSRMGSAAFLDCVAVLAEVGGIWAFIHAVVDAKQAEQWNLIWPGLGIWILCDALAHVALHPSMVNLSISGEVRASEEALGILSFFAKAIVRIVPLAFGVGVVIGVLFLAWSHIPLIRQNQPAGGLEALKLICACACLPLAGYVFFALYHLTIDLLCAILAVPRKLDELIQNRKS